MILPGRDDEGRKIILIRPGNIYKNDDDDDDKTILLDTGKKLDKLQP